MLSHSDAETNSVRLLVCSMFQSRGFAKPKALTPKLVRVRLAKIVRMSTERSFLGRITKTVLTTWFYTVHTTDTTDIII